MAIAGSLALIAILMEPEKLQQLQFRKFIFAAPFIFYRVKPCLVASGHSSSSYFVLILVVIFTTCLRIIYVSLPPNLQYNFKHQLGGSLLLGIIVSVAIGSYPLFWPELSEFVNEISNQVTFANIELIKQSNRSLSPNSRFSVSPCRTLLEKGKMASHPADRNNIFCYS